MIRFKFLIMDIPLYFYLAYSDLDRLSPGSDETTIEVLKRIDNKNLSNILDIGCGVGQATILLAEFFKDSTVEAIDLFNHYLTVLDEKIAENNLGDRVFTYRMDMKDPDFANEEFDMVYCEAAVEIMGFGKALKEWKRLLKPDGYLVVSDISWISKPSSESKKFWKNTYGEVDFIENKISQIKDEGYEFIDYVTVPKEDWKRYCDKLEINLNSLKGDKSARDFVGQLKKEIEVYRRNSDDYSYVFYIMKLP